MAKLLYDTDVLIDHLDGRRSLPAGEDVAYSSVTRAELYSGKTDEADIDSFLEPFEEIVIDRPVAEEAGRIRRITRIKLPDALVAASAMLTGRGLVTSNVRDFRKVKGLRIHAK